jgi:hypothetical protein
MMDSAAGDDEAARLVATAHRLSQLIVSLRRVPWSQSEPAAVAELTAILDDVRAGAAARDRARLRAAYVALNGLGSTVRFGGQDPDDPVDPAWDHLRVNEILDSLLSLGTPAPSSADPPEQRKPSDPDRR